MGLQESLNKDVSSLKPSARVQKLKDELLDAPHTYSPESALLYTQSYRQTEGQPAVLRRAKALYSVYTGMSIYIRDGELIVGNRSEKLGAMPVAPGTGFVDNEKVKNDPCFSELVAYWKDHTLNGFYQDLISREAKAAEEEQWVGLPAGRSSGFGHIIGDYEMVIKEGALNIAARAKAQREKFSPEEEKQRAFCEASAIACEGLAELGFRYSKLAGEMAASCADPSRKAELQEISRICARVPAYPARNFREAVQSFWFTHQAVFIEQPAGSISFGGLDMYLYPYMRKDLEEGSITWEAVEELLENFFVKFMENAVWPRSEVLFPHMSIGGQDISGNDLTNDLTFLLLETMAKIRSSHPMLSVRWHENIDRRFWKRAVECMKLGLGMPAFFSDKPMIEALVSWGIPRSEAVNYGVVGCVEPALKGKLHGQTLGAHLNVGKCLELALNDGKSFYSGKQLGPHTGTLEDFKSMDDLWAAYTDQVEAGCRLNVETVHATDKIQRKYYGYPLLSSTMEGAIENGRDLTEGVKYNNPTVCVVGMPNVVDAFLALEQLVFKAGKYTAAQVMTALRNNYEGFEDMRLALLNYPEKFGSGDAKYSDLFNRLCAVHEKALEKYSGPRGGYLCSGIWPVTWHVSMGRFTGPTPDGRRSGEPLVDGVGAGRGRDRNGPTAVAGNVAGIDAVKYWPGGYTFNIRFNSSMLSKQEGVEKLSAFIEAYFRMGGMQLQINTIGKEVLLAAKAEPVKYADLVVRVAGFSAYFTCLQPDVQDEIIARTEHEI